VADAANWYIQWYTLGGKKSAGHVKEKWNTTAEV